MSLPLLQKQSLTKVMSLTRDHVALMITHNESCCRQIVFDGTIEIKLKNLRGRRKLLDKDDRPMWSNGGDLFGRGEFGTCELTRIKRDM